MFKKIIVVLTVVLSTYANAGLVVIGSPDLNGIIDIKDVKRLYLGKKTHFNGGNLVAIELDTSLPEKKEFHEKVTRKSLSQLEAYWSKQLFTGKGKAPQSVMSQEELLSKVIKGVATVGYIDESLVGDDVSILLRL